MRRLTRWLVSSLAALSLLAGVWLPAAPAAAEGESPTDVVCEQGQFRQDDADGARCVPLPVGQSFVVTEDVSQPIWDGSVYFRAGEYRYSAVVDISSGYYLSKLTLAVDTVGATSETYSSNPLFGGYTTTGELNAPFVIPEDGFYQVRLTASTGKGIFATADSAYGTATLGWQPIQACPAGEYRLDYYHAGAGRIAFSTCSPKLSGDWPNGRPTEAWLNDWYVVASDPVKSAPHSRAIIAHNGSVLPTAPWTTAAVGDGFVILENNGASESSLALRFTPPATGAATLELLDSCAANEWLGLYYKDGSGNPAYATCEARPDYTWNPGQPGPWAGYSDSERPTGSWRATWIAWVDLDGGTYTFYGESDNEVALQVNGSELWSGKSTSGAVELSAGLTRLQFQYTAAADPSAADARIARLWWKQEGTEEQAPRCPATSLLAEYSVTEGTRADFATCETPGKDMGQRHPRQWAEELDQYHILWSGDLLLPAGQYTFTAQADSDNEVELRLNGHPVVALAGEGGTTTTAYKLDQQAYRMEGTYTGDGSEQQSLISWAFTGNSAHTCPTGEFLVEYSNGASDCQPLALFGQEISPPLSANISWIRWTGLVSFDEGRYLFFAPDGGVTLQLTQMSSPLVILDGTATTDEPAEWYLGGVYQMDVEMQTVPGQPLPRVWWSPTGSPRLVSYALTGETTVQLTFDRDLRPAPDGAATGFFAYHKANDELVPNEVTAVSVDGRGVTLTLKNSVLPEQTATLSYFPAPETAALEDATHGPAARDVAAGKDVEGGGGVICAPVSGVSGPLGGDSQDALLLTPEKPAWRVDLGDEYWLDEVRLSFTQLPSNGNLLLSVSTEDTTGSPANWTPVHTWDLASLAGQTAASLGAADFEDGHLLARHLRLEYQGGSGSDAIGIDRFGALGNARGNVVSFFPPVTFSGDRSAPQLVTRIDGKKKVELNVDLIVLTYNKALDTRSVPAPGDYTVTVDGSVRTPTSVVVQENTVTLYLPVSVKFGQNVTLGYTPGTAPVRDVLGHEAAAITPPVTVDPVSVEMINIARWGTPTATQSSNPENAGNAIDGDPGTVARTKQEQSPWWQVDLGQVSTLFDLKLFVPSSSGGTPQYLIAVSDDGKNWTSAYQHDGSGFDSNGLTIDLQGLKGRYLRITTLESTELVFSEVEIWGFPPRSN